MMGFFCDPYLVIIKLEVRGQECCISFYSVLFPCLLVYLRQPRDDTKIQTSHSIRSYQQYLGFTIFTV
jgi:hypothetical protein